MNQQPEAPPKWREVWDANKGFVAVGFGGTTLLLLIVAIIQGQDLQRKYPWVSWGTVPESFAAVGTVLAVAVALWQSLVIRRQAKADNDAAAEQFQTELDAAAERHRVELENQRELARVQRVHVQEQEFKLALIRVSRAANAYTQGLATLIAETNRIIALPSRQERDDALKPISKELATLLLDVSAETTGAGFFTNNPQLHDALDDITQAAIRGPEAEMNYRNHLTFRGEMPNQAPIFMAMEGLPQAIGNARRLAGQLLTTGWS